MLLKVSPLLQALACIRGLASTLPSCVRQVVEPEVQAPRSAGTAQLGNAHPQVERSRSKLVFEDMIGRPCTHEAATSIGSRATF